MKLIYLVGQPGVGKTTAMDGALLRLGLHRQQVIGRVPHEVLMRERRIVGAHLGVTKKNFGGTDGLSMSIAPFALSWLSVSAYPLIVAEGDRLTSRKWLGEATAYADVTLVHLSVPNEVAAARRKARAERIGAPSQSPVWVRGRITKVANLVAEWPGDLFTIDGTLPASDVAQAFAAIIDECSLSSTSESEAKSPTAN